MATNALVIEFGATGPMTSEVRQAIEGIIGKLNGLKGDSLIEGFRFYPVVTGNRTQRVAMVILETSHQQLEALVVHKSYVNLLESITAVGVNVTINRAITIERMLELSKQLT